MDYLIDRYERVLKFFKIPAPTTVSILFVVGIIVSDKTTSFNAINTLLIMLIAPPRHYV